MDVIFCAMKLLSMVAGIVTLTASAHGRDSTWLVCTSDSLLVSSHEHRAGDGRATSLNLIFGVHDLRGELKDADSGRISLKAAGETGTTFSGTISIDYEAKQLSLKGTLKLDGEPSPIDATMECKEMSTDL